MPWSHFVGASRGPASPRPTKVSKVRRASRYLIWWMVIVKLGHKKNMSHVQYSSLLPYLLISTAFYCPTSFFGSFFGGGSHGLTYSQWICIQNLFGKRHMLGLSLWKLVHWFSKYCFGLQKQDTETTKAWTEPPFTGGTDAPGGVHVLMKPSNTHRHRGGEQQLRGLLLHQARIRRTSEAESEKAPILPVNLVVWDITDIRHPLLLDRLSDDSSEAVRVLKHCDS